MNKSCALIKSCRSRDSSVSIVTGYGLNCRGFDSRQEQNTFVLSVQTDYEVHPDSYPVGTGVKAAGS
jgi:hypothetical protein